MDARIAGHLHQCGPCPYLPGREFTAFVPTIPLSGPVYRQLMDAGFRRSGSAAYLPLCDGCRACRPIRCAVETFRPRTDQRRIARRNQDLVIDVVPRGKDAERESLYRRYQEAVHGDGAAEGLGPLSVEAGVPGVDVLARTPDGVLLAVSCVDTLGDALSSVYCYYDPDQRQRGLGTFMVLTEIALARAWGMRWLYLGFLVSGCQKMRYKGRFGPCEVLSDGQWTAFDALKFM